MKKMLMLSACVGAGLMLAVPAIAQSIGEKTGINAVTGVSPSTTDFVKEVAISDMFEIESSKLAEQKGSADDKAFAAKMVTDHGKTTSELKSLVQSGKVKADLPTAMDSSHQSKIDKLKSLNGEDFNKQYNSDQVSAHKDAVSLFERYAKGGDNDALKNWTGTTLPTLQQHLKMAQDLNKT